VSRRDTIQLLLLSAIWGGSFLFIKVGVDELEPSVVALSRVAIGALVLLPLLLSRGGVRPLRNFIVPLVILASFNNALPFWLFGFAEQSISSGLTAVIQAAAPLFTVLLATRMDHTQRVTGVRLVGICVGFVGVVFLVGLQSGGDLVAAFAVVGVALCYSFSVLYAGQTMRGLSPLHVSFGQLGFASLILLPFGLAQRPDALPSGTVLLAMLALGALGSGVAYLLYFSLIASAGASRAILVTYLVPAIALVYGAVLLDEEVTISSLIGLGLILTGTALATGVARFRAASLAK
jgi:drug/metabolite transporter (DMT)-like permease